MARQPQVTSSSSRQQSAPINIEYGNLEQGEHQRYWREEHIRWNNHHQFNDDDDEDHVEHNGGQDEDDEDQMTMMQNGFSGGVIEPPSEGDETERHDEDEKNDDDDNDVDAGHRHNEDAIRRQKIAQMNDDLFEQLLAENERKLRQLISYVENVHLILK